VATRGLRAGRPAVTGHGRDPTQCGLHADTDFEMSDPRWIYSSPAQTPPPHCGRPQPKEGAPESLEIGKLPPRPRPVCAAAGTLNCLATSRPPHFGHRAASPAPRTRVSKV